MNNRKSNEGEERKGHGSEQGRKEYMKPSLKEYGHVVSMTQSATGPNKDGIKPNTRA